MGHLLDQLREIGSNESTRYPDDSFRIRGLWRVDYRYRPNEWERDLAYSMVYVQTVWQGCCYQAYQDVCIDEDLLGADAREVRPRDLGSAIAALDAVFAVFTKKPQASHTFEGRAEEKTVKRASIVVGEVMRELNGSRGRVLNVGVMGNFLRQLTESGVDVIGSDFDEKIIGRSLSGARVESGQRTLALIQECDLVLATGMTLRTDTLEQIIETAQRYDKKLILFAATGAHFGEAYCRSFGVDVVLSEVQPQYMFQGVSRIDVYRRQETDQGERRVQCQPVEKGRERGASPRGGAMP